MRPEKLILGIQRLDFQCSECAQRADFEVTRPSHFGVTAKHYCKAHVPSDAATMWRDEETAEGIGPLVERYGL